MPTLLETFDLPQMNPHCTERKQSNVVAQPLYLLNNGMIHELAGAFTHRVIGEVGDDPTARVNRAWLVAMGRDATAEEVSLSLTALARLIAQWEQETPDEEAAFSPADRALTDYCHALLNSAEFLYVD